MEEEVHSPLRKVRVGSVASFRKPHAFFVDTFTCTSCLPLSGVQFTVNEVPWTCLQQVARSFIGLRSRSSHPCNGGRTQVYGSILELPQGILRTFVPSWPVFAITEVSIAGFASSLLIWIYVDGEQPFTTTLWGRFRVYLTGRSAIGDHP